jgi:hypothetical protein
MSDQNKSPPESELTAVLKMMKDIALMLALSTSYYLRYEEY